MGQRLFDVFDSIHSLLFGQSQSVQERLFDAICKGDLESAKFCLENGAKLNEKDKCGWTPCSLHIATNNSVEMVEFLSTTQSYKNVLQFIILTRIRLSF